jgi:hypothetical protein
MVLLGASISLARSCWRRSRNSQRVLVGQPMRFAVNPQYNLRDLERLTEWKVSFTVALLVPASLAGSLSWASRLRQRRPCPKMGSSLSEATC